MQSAGAAAAPDAKTAGVGAVEQASMPAGKSPWLAKVREQIRFLKDEEYNYDQLRVYVRGIADPWVFGPADEFEFDGELLVVRVGPADEYENQGVPEHAFLLRDVAATELAVGGA